jgi:small GTP-binding protein
MDTLETESKLFRVVTIGDTCVGKTSIISQLVQGQFDSDQPSTVGAMFVLHAEVINGRRIEMQVWDTAGQERFRSLGPIYYRNASAALVVFDLTRPDTFKRIESWIGAFLNIAGDRALVCVVGNKADLEESLAVTDEEVKSWAEQRHCPYLKTSAKTGLGVRTVFHTIAEELVKREAQINHPETAFQRPPPENTGCC